MKKIYFVIPVYNVEKYLHRCVDSALAQSYPYTEIILIDDGSPDGCPAICDEYAQKHSNIHVIHKPNGGLSDARNAGLDYVMKNCIADNYIAFLDSDDFVHRDFAAELIDLCEKNNCGIAQCNYEKGSADSFAPNAGADNAAVLTYEAALLGYRLKSQCCAKIYKAGVIGDIRFPVGMLNEDEFVIYKFVSNAVNVAFTDKNLYYYYQHGTSIMDEIAKKLKNNPHRYDYLKAYKQRIAFFEQHGNRDLVLKTHEKICTDVILRYCEQMHLDKGDRDEDVSQYIKIYNENYKIMIKRKGIPFKRKMMYKAFRICPMSGVWMSRIFTLRK
ncbi:MAG: glycosyltransferase [Clostridia bacterium]|nr:glycosyltransferase [Clostridia bacterium]